MYSLNVPFVYFLVYESSQKYVQISYMVIPNIFYTVIHGTQVMYPLSNNYLKARVMKKVFNKESFRGLSNMYRKVYPLLTMFV